VPETAPEHLLVAGEVVRALDAPHTEAAVLAGPRPALLEDDHAAHGAGALDGADVVALDARGGRGEAERIGQLRQRLERLALVGQPARLLPGQRLGRVARGEDEQ